MLKRGITVIGALAIVALAATLPVSTQGTPVPDLVITAYNGGPAIPYATPKTPWGDPDLQGVWSSDDAGMPMSRPANATGLYMNDEQFAARQKQIAQGVTNAENAEGSFRGDFARRAFRQTSLIVDPPDGRQPAVNPEAAKRRAPRDQGTFGNGPFDWTTDFTLYDRCVTRGVVGSILRVIYGNGNRIVQAPGVVAITYEMIHDTRVFYTDGRPHIGQPIRQYLGDSRARWEGDVLVVETTNLTDQTSIGPNGNGLRHSAQMTFTEKFKRVAGDILQYQITIDDPVTYARPYTISMPWTPLDGGMLLPYECHEGNYAIENSLGAERAEDRALAADLAKGITRARRPVQDGLGVGGQPVVAGRGRGAGPGGPGAGGTGTAAGEGGPAAPPAGRGN
jgi:nucleoside diphosphate kinase